MCAMRSMIRGIVRLLLVLFVMRGVVSSAEAGARGHPSSEDIQRRIDSLPSEGGEIKLKRGRIRLSKPLRLKIGVTLSGEGLYATELYYTGEGAVIEIVGEPKAKLRYVTIKDLRIRGERNSKNTTNGLYLRDAVEIAVRDVYIGPVSGYGLYIDRNSWSLRFCHLAIHGNSAGGVLISGLANNTISISDSRVQGNYGPGIIVKGATGLSIQGTDIEGNTEPGIRVLHSYGLSVNGCYFEKNAYGRNYRGVRAQILIGEPNEEGYGPGGNGVLISGSYFYGSSNDTEWGVVLKKARGFNICANTFLAHITGGVWVGKFCEDGLITANAFVRTPYKGKFSQPVRVRNESSSTTVLPAKPSQ